MNSQMYVAIACVYLASAFGFNKKSAALCLAIAYALLAAM